MPRSNLRRMLCVVLPQFPESPLRFVEALAEGSRTVNPSAGSLSGF